MQPQIEGPKYMTGETDDHKLSRLTDAWKYAKDQEKAFNETRIRIESEIYELCAGKLLEKGTFTTETGMKITTGFSEDWSSDVIQKAYERWPVESVKFPFAATWKPDGKAIGVI